MTDMWRFRRPPTPLDREDIFKDNFPLLMHVNDTESAPESAFTQRSNIMLKDQRILTLKENVILFETRFAHNGPRQERLIIIFSAIVCKNLCLAFKMEHRWHLIRTTTMLWISLLQLQICEHLHMAYRTLPDGASKVTPSDYSR